jgi:aminoglycoside 6'-N-acetyltransferase
MIYTEYTVYIYGFDSVTARVRNSLNDGDLRPKTVRKRLIPCQAHPMESLCTEPAMRSFKFTPIDRADFPLLSCWLSTPHVARWWNDDPSPEAVENDYGGCVDGAEPCEVFMAHCNGAPVGLIQRYRFGAYPQYMDEVAHILHVSGVASSIDYMIGPADALGKGIGTAMIAAFVARTWDDDPDTPAIIVPVQADNRASWRALERASFARIAAGELEPDNPIDSSLHYIYRLDRASAA